MKQLAIIGDYDSERPSHRATEASIEHARVSGNLDIEYTWIRSSEVRRSQVANYSGIWIAPGPPHEDLKGTLLAIETAREERIPLLGTCGGFQLVALEFIRNVLGMLEADHAEYSPTSSQSIVVKSACSIAGQEMSLNIIEGNTVSELYGAQIVKEKLLLFIRD